MNDSFPIKFGQTWFVPFGTARMKRPFVMFIGLRGIGGIQGGIETHVTELVRNLPLSRDEIEVVGRTPYRQDALDTDESLAMVRWLPTLRQPQLEAVVHSLISVCYAAWRRPRVLHVHGIGPGLITPLARLLGLRVVVTHHGKDYLREKWGRFARLILRFGERNSMMADVCISISPIVADELRQRYNRDVLFIPNGVSPQPLVAPGSMLSEYGLEPKRFVINVARLVPEKRQLDLIDAFERVAMPGVKLVLVGGADHESPYARQVRARAEANPQICMMGFLSGAPLAEIFNNAGLFVLPSAHEGMPITLLEAMAYKHHVLVSDLPIYRAMGLPEQAIFPLGDINVLAARLQAFFVDEISDVDWSEFLEGYRWEQIAKQTVGAYLRIHVE